MADNRKRLSDLPVAESVTGLYTLGVDSHNEGVRIAIGDVMMEMQTTTSITTPRLFVNANELLHTVQKMTLETVVSLLISHEHNDIFMKSGLVVTFFGNNGWESWQWGGQNWLSTTSWKPYRYTVQEVESEDAMDAMIEAGTVDPTVMYFVPEE